MHPINFYPNFVPIQELSDWFEHWATVGREAGLPLRIRRAVHLGLDDVSRLVQGQARIRQRAGAVGVLPGRVERAVPRRPRVPDQRAGKSEPALGGEAVPRRQALASLGLSERSGLNALRRTISRLCHVSHGQLAGLSHLGRVRDFAVGARALLEAARGVDKSRRECKVDWENLQRPGFSPDYIDQRYERMDLAFERSDWIATPAAQALLRNNRPLLAYIAGKPAAFTSKDHNFLPGETVEKQIIVINNSRETVSCDCEWSLALPQHDEGQQESHRSHRTAGTDSVALRIAGDAGTGPVRVGSQFPVQQRRNTDGQFLRDGGSCGRSDRAADPADAGAKIGVVRSPGRNRRAVEEPGSSQPNN